MPFKYLLNPGHSACSGCGEILAMRHVLEAAGRNTIVTNATGCSEVTTTRYPMSAFKVPWIHANFENAAPLASGIRAALNYKDVKKKERKKEKKQDSIEKELTNQPINQSTNIIAWGGDGATFDIGIGMISGMWERGEDVLYVCFDNEAYMNTGIQASGSTPYGSNTTTTQPGKESTGNNLYKKDMLKIALAHNCTYVGSATVGNVMDIQAKVKKALALPGPKYIQILVTCVPGWYTDSKDTIKVAKLAQQTGVFPVVEYVEGKLANVAKCPKPRPKVEDYLKLQGRYKHLFKPEVNQVEIDKIQALADRNISRYNLT
ncbi:pyruvate ferredoxin oxidoreductase [Candidatus Falkowbacteria bacterium]|nr:pyruvate ferredoxin oxidoreductase [Candidatus Falkowbacteria bacterium]MBT5503728.1 pyruvate ferredoxin oxidoreductase [Candidatus Falkowbacteria bacterium]MBT6573792.1 pyruvate ferredoxin oxidoreductase [Candidatus Falkowbacteria bacterium]MBT7348117.1 pyruvate ferredoxin oxidoreductase [Candidatus Falkowbacteria bacterium]MBT7500703.1 pyruvate ferredoxin oxidoreductase [Candidatus Falkowbacteria bacterium]